MECACGGVLYVVSSRSCSAMSPRKAERSKSDSVSATWRWNSAFVRRRHVLRARLDILDHSDKPPAMAAAVSRHLARDALRVCGDALFAIHAAGPSMNAGTWPFLFCGEGLRIRRSRAGKRK